MVDQQKGWKQGRDDSTKHFIIPNALANSGTFAGMWRSIKTSHKSRYMYNTKSGSILISQ